MTNHDLLTAQYTHTDVHVPDHDHLRKEFDAIISEINAARKTKAKAEGKPPPADLTNGFYRSIGDSVFDAGCLALSDFVEHYKPFSDGDAAITGGSRNRIRVVSAPVGSGKTTFTAAFIAALIRYADQDPQSPTGALVVVNQIEKANDTFHDLNALLPGKVAVWTTEHDPACRLKDEDRKVPPDKLPEKRFTKDNLQHYPVAIVTHAFYSHAGNHKARHLFHDDKLQPRAFTAIDERFEDVTIYDVALSEAEKVREAIWADPQHSKAIGPHMEALCKI
jgi:hypothetical protein